MPIRDPIIHVAIVVKKLDFQPLEQNIWEFHLCILLYYGGLASLFSLFCTTVSASRLMPNKTILRLVCIRALSIGTVNVILTNAALPSTET